MTRTPAAVPPFPERMEGEGASCNDCGKAVDMTFHGLCRACTIDSHDDDDQCWQCHGEGFTYDCFEEWACVDPESGCDLCTSRCDVCRPRLSITREPQEG